MDEHNLSRRLESSLGLSDIDEADQHLPGQVLFMDSNEVATRAATRVPSTGYYQVATPKSPHESTLENELMHSSNHDIIGISGDSEDTERFKYENAKTEIMDTIHLYSRLNNRDTDKIKLELKRVNAKIALLKKVHDDKDFKVKVEGYQVKQNEKKKIELERARNVSGGYYGDGSSVSFSMNSNSNNLSYGSNGSKYYYQTRSKSQGNITELPNLRPANSSIMDLRLTGIKSVPMEPIGHIPPDLSKISHASDTWSNKSNQMNPHHRRNYSSTCVTSNSGIVGKTENNEPIFKRYDGILVVITCSFCGRTGFSSAQGIVNHTRLKHSKNYANQPLAVLFNQKMLNDSKQDPSVLEKFKYLKLDPSKEYLPSEVAIPKNEKKNVIQNFTSDPKYENTSDNSFKEISTKYLGKLYDNQEDFDSLVDMVKEAPRDLEHFLKQTESDSELSPQEDGSEFDITKTEEELMTELDDLEEKSPDYDPSDQNSSSSVSTYGEETPTAYTANISESYLNNRESNKSGRMLRKRKSKSEVDDFIPMKERLRPADKKARPDVISLTELPEHEKRSSHYNLRARSKLKSHHLNLD